MKATDHERIRKGCKQNVGDIASKQLLKLFLAELKSHGAHISGECCGINPKIVIEFCGISEAFD
jgi:hypothetical protein